MTIGSGAKYVHIKKDLACVLVLPVFPKLPRNIKQFLASGLLQTGTNVKSVETALRTWGSYHLYIYILYISQEISSFPFYKTLLSFFLISISLSSEIWASHFHSIRTSASLEKTTESYVGSPQNSLPAKSCQLREILIHIPNKPCTN